MNRGELIDAVREDCSDDIQTKAAAERIVESVFANMASALADGEEVQIYNFGTFAVVDRAARQGVNPQTHEKLKIPATRVIKFRPVSRLKAELASKKKKKK